MQTITEYIAERDELKESREKYKNSDLGDFVESSDLFKFDDITLDDDTDEVCKVIYLNKDKTETWAISDILSYSKAEDVPEERREIWIQYMSQYDWEDPTYYNAKAVLDRFNQGV